MTLVWRNQLSVGNDTIDNDHKRLIEIINKIQSCLAANSRVDVLAALEDLKKYSEMHFGREERIARIVEFDTLDQLHSSHESLLEQLDDVRQKLRDESIPLEVDAVVRLLRDWLIEHVMKQDMLLKPLLQKYPPNFGDLF